MYAIVDIAGQQFKVEAGNEIFCNRLPAAKDSAVEFDKVLLIDTDGQIQLGNPYVKGAVVKATVLADDVKADKVLVFKKIARASRSAMAIARSFQKSVSTLSLNFLRLEHYGTQKRTIKFKERS